MKNYIYNYLWVVELLVVLWVINKFKWAGLWAVVIIISAFALFKLCVGREFILYYMRQLEEKIWGKPVR